MTRSLQIDERHVATSGLEQKCLVRGEQRTQFRVFNRRAEGVLLQIGRPDPRHPQLADRRPERLRHAGLIREWPEIPTLLRQIEQQPHDQGWTNSLFRRFDPALDEKRRAHAQRQIERSHEPEVQPVRAAQGNPLSERPADGMRRDEYPLGAGDLCATELR